MGGHIRLIWYNMTSVESLWIHGMRGRERDILSDLAPLWDWRCVSWLTILLDLNQDFSQESERAQEAKSNKKRVGSGMGRTLHGGQHMVDG